jgi:hypothetical protein
MKSLRVLFCVSADICYIFLDEKLESPILCVSADSDWSLRCFFVFHLTGLFLEENLESAILCFS